MGCELSEEGEGWITEAALESVEVLAGDADGIGELGKCLPMGQAQLAQPGGDGCNSHKPTSMRETRHAQGYTGHENKARAASVVWI
jgi:hypothetical protein